MLRATSLCLYRHPLPNEGARVRRIERNAVFYHRWRDLFLTCLRESSWCSRHINALKSQAMTQCVLRHTTFTAVIHSRRYISQLSESSKQTQTEIRSHTAALLPINKKISIIMKKISSHNKKQNKKTSVNATIGKRVSQNKSSLLSLQRLSNLKKTAHEIQSKIVQLESALLRMTMTIAIARRQQLALTTRLESLDSIESDLDDINRQISQFQLYLQYIRTSQMPFRERYRQLVCSGQTELAERFLIAKYQAVMKCTEAGEMGIAMDTLFKMKSSDLPVLRHSDILRAPKIISPIINAKLFPRVLQNADHIINSPQKAVQFAVHQKQIRAVIAHRSKRRNTVERSKAARAKVIRLRREKKAQRRLSRMMKLKK